MAKGENLKALTSGVEQVLIANEERQENLVFLLPIAVYTTDRHGVIMLFNELAAELWGCRPEIGQDKWCGSCKIFHRDGSPMAFDDYPMAIALKEGRAVRGVEIIIERPDGSKKWVEPHPIPIFDGSGVMSGALNMLLDISDRKLAEQVLETRVLERTAELEALCFSIAHDLRHSIRGVNINSRMLEESWPACDSETATNLNRLMTATKRMDCLVSAMLNYARLSRDQLSLEVIDISKLGLEIAASIASQYPQVAFRIQPGLTVEGDASLVHVVFSNLIDNACKYSQHANGPIVEVGVDRGAIFVRDNGLGFQMQYADQIFLPFHRLNRDADYPGTGIGLASVRRIVQKHGGRIWTESELGKGSTFYVDFAG